MTPPFCFLLCIEVALFLSSSLPFKFGIFRLDIGMNYAIAVKVMQCGNAVRSGVNAHLL